MSKGVDVGRRNDAEMCEVEKVKMLDALLRALEMLEGERIPPVFFGLGPVGKAAAGALHRTSFSRFRPATLGPGKEEAGRMRARAASICGRRRDGGNGAGGCTKEGGKRKEGNQSQKNGRWIK